MRRWKKLLVDTAASWNEHNAATQSAALAFYTIFSLAPVLIVVIALVGAVFGRDAVRGQINSEFQSWMGKDAAAFVLVVLKSANKPDSSKLVRIIGIATLLFGATGVFVQLQESLNIIWGVKPRPGAAFTRLFRKRMLSFAIILGMGFLLVVSLVLSAGLHALGSFLEARLAIPVALLHFADILISFGLVTLLFALIYRLLPDVELHWHDVVQGAVVTSLLFAIGKALIGLYLGRTGIASAYGAAGSLVMLLSWVYYSALIFLFGAEFTRIRSYGRDTLPQPEPGAARREEPAPLDKQTQRRSE
ncbi:MAG TPA: YihY/virulence factor BrkB family protein [Thermoanaerobaculia bacterium]|nr:YihY/virulence factor BrkB family protein [Thermoanaerobaculia bacterium]